MGDIIIGFLIIIIGIIFFLVGAIRKTPLLLTILYLLLFGSGIGILISLQFKDVELYLGLVFFSIQFSAIVLVLSKRYKIGYFLLYTSLIIQTPILNLPTLSYRCQTLFSYYLMEFPGKITDLEPGSYLIYTERIPAIAGNEHFPFGINITSLALLIYFYSVRRKYKKNNEKASYNS